MRMSKWVRFAAALGTLLCAAPAAVLGQLGVPVRAPVRPIPAVEHVLIISIDGLRPDRALWANMPNLRSLAKGGTYSFWAKTTPLAITLPSHVSMLTGVAPYKHGIEWNRELPFSEPVYPRVPTVFEMAHRSGYTTVLVAGKSKFSALNKPGTLTDADVVPDHALNNDRVAEGAVARIEKIKPNLMFVHFPDVDATGHSKGWGSHEQLAAIERTDVFLGDILAALDRADIRKSTVIIISADHGGTGLGHGPDDPRSRYIPWIANGPGIRKDYDLTQLRDLDVKTEDTAATTCYLLGLPVPPNFDGQVVRAAFE
jgi:arylsulfatase A-like enzyme